VPSDAETHGASYRIGWHNFKQKPIGDTSGRSAVDGWTISRKSGGLAGAGGNSGGVKAVLRWGAMR
jgi:hypothetical protein